MNLSKAQLWDRFQKHYTEFPDLGLAIDLSRVNFPDDFFAAMEPRLQRAYAEMAELEAGSIANKDEGRMVGHYWLRNAALAPRPELRAEIEDTLAALKAFVAEVHTRKVQGVKGPFHSVLVVGIGGSALGPQFVAHALGQPGQDRLRPHFFDNTDPDGMDKVLGQLAGELGRTLCVVISKSGGTKETRNGMLEAEAAWGRAGLEFAKHAVAVTGVNSELDKYASDKKWLRRFPMWDWVGGRTSELCAVGLLPAALQGLDIDGMLAGARACDEVTRQPVTARNPAAQLALMWHFLGSGRGAKDMVVLPYKDRLELFSKYLQQLVMESLGKELDRDGKVVNQGIAVYGNKGSTDQHAYVQQLREGVLNFFVVFIEVLQDRAGASMAVEPGVTSGDFLGGFLLGTREALYEKGRQSITLTVRDCSAFTVGMLIALFERAVGLYASLVNINAYHQPGVEAGKKAAGAVIALQSKLVAHLTANRGKDFSASEIAEAIASPDSVETVFKICEHLAANQGRGITRSGAETPAAARYAAG
ncbi:MAG TPA: glucose-6-phosphate isomerase [Verrucomicrobiae bacterium]|nr:glucose-6-phosphate isomerase [Verrucomicrobiae bacterium]